MQKLTEKNKKALNESKQRAANEIRELVEKKGLGRKQLSRMTGIHIRNIQKLLNTEDYELSLDVLLKLLNFLISVELG